MRRVLVVAQWMFALAAAACLLGLVTKPEVEVDLSRKYSVGSQEGNLTIRMYAVPRDPPDVDPDHAIGPDTVNIPLWLVAAVCALLAGVCGRQAVSRR